MNDGKKTVNLSSLLNSYFATTHTTGHSKFSDIIKKWLEIRSPHAPTGSGIWWEIKDSTSNVLVPRTHPRGDADWCQEKKNKNSKCCLESKAICTLHFKNPITRTTSEWSLRSALDSQGSMVCQRIGVAFTAWRRGSRRILSDTGRLIYLFFFGSRGRGTVSSSIPSLSDKHLC